MFYSPDDPYCHENTYPLVSELIDWDADDMARDAEDALHPEDRVRFTDDGVRFIELSD